ncbi:MAG: type 4a pilus biogenesis protein PilO [Bdellovibrionales bacterium]
MKLTDVLSRISTQRAALIGVLLGVFYYFLMYDDGANLRNAIAQSEAQKTQLQAQIKESQDKLDRAAVYKKAAAEVGNTISKLLTLIPDKFNMADLMRIVSNEAKVAGTSLTTLKPGKVNISEVANEFQELTVELDMSGSFLQHMVFLSNLTKINQILIIKEFKFDHERDGRGDEPPVVKFVSEIVAFRYRGEELKKEQEAPPGEGQTQ